MNTAANGTYAVPADAPQPSGTAIDTGDSRLLGAVQRYGKVYTASTTQHLDAWTSSTPNPAANAQWYEITPISADAFGPGWSHAISHPAVAFYFPGVIPGCGGGLNGDACGTPFVGFEVTGSSADSTPASVFLGRDAVPPA